MHCHRKGHVFGLEINFLWVMRTKSNRGTKNSYPEQEVKPKLWKWQNSTCRLKLEFKEPKSTLSINQANKFMMHKQTN